jgi:hypothetical protein
MLIPVPLTSERILFCAGLKVTANIRGNVIEEHSTSFEIETCWLLARQYNL